MLCISTNVFEILEIISSNEWQSQHIFNFSYQKRRERSVKGTDLRLIEGSSCMQSLLHTKLICFIQYHEVYLRQRTWQNSDGKVTFIQKNETFSS